MAVDVGFSARMPTYVLNKNSFQEASPQRAAIAEVNSPH
jgi:hypothetical protein